MSVEHSIASIEQYLTGEKLVGDDFSPEEIQAWLRDEAEGYAGLVDGYSDKGHNYEYHAWNVRHGFRHLKTARLNSVLGLGSAYGLEFLPILSRIRQLTIIEPTEYFARDNILERPVAYCRPGPLGEIPTESGTQDLVTSFGVLHHIPNVSFIIREVARVLRPGGYFLVREPITSMGDWRKPRPGLTRRERGIPDKWLRAALVKSGFTIEHAAYIDFPLVRRLALLTGASAFNSRLLVLIDEILARAFSGRARYHARNGLEKLRPTGIYIVARR